MIMKIAMKDFRTAAKISDSVSFLISYQMKDTLDSFCKLNNLNKPINLNKLINLSLLG